MRPKKVSEHWDTYKIKTINYKLKKIYENHKKNLYKIIKIEL